MQLKLKLTAVAAAMAVTSMAFAQEQVVKIGHVAPMSGAQASYGKDNENGARMAIQELNAQGITIGGKKIKFELMAEDDAADPKQGTAAAQKLCDSKVAGVVGPSILAPLSPHPRSITTAAFPMSRAQRPTPTSPSLATRPHSASLLTTTPWGLAWLSTLPIR